MRTTFARDFSSTVTTKQSLRDALAEPVRLMMVIAYHTGARAGEVLSLRWDRVDLEGGVVLPPGAQQRNKRVGAWPIYADLERALREARFVRDRDWPNVDLVVHRGGRKLVDYRDARAAGRQVSRGCGFTICGVPPSGTCLTPDWTRAR